MTAAQTWPFPPARSLHGWFRDLSTWQPQQLWFSHLLLHRVEALASVAHRFHLDPFQRALLRRFIGSAVSLDQLQVDRQFLGQWLHGLAELGLLRAQNPGWELTAAGRHAVETGSFTQPRLERRVFYFVDNRACDKPAHFLALAQPALPNATPGADFSFDPTWLTSCLQQSLEWKSRHQFSADVEAILVGDTSAAGPGDKSAALPWRHVMLDRPEQLPVALIRTRDDVIHGFQVNVEDWKLRHDKPILTVPEGWDALLPELTKEPPPEAWHSSWQSWCQQRNLPATETDGCVLRRSGFQLEVSVPKRLLERLKTTRHDVLHGDTWLLAGTGRTRTAACVKIVEAEG